MNIAVFGTGVVGSTIATKLLQLGHAVKMGSRTADNEKGSAWVRATGGQGSLATYADAASFGQLAFNCTSGAGALAALAAAGPQNLAGKILIDVTNPLDFSKGMPPSLSVCNTDSLAEQIQRALPETKVVKALNTVSAPLMVDPGQLAGAHDMFLSGNDAAARGQVTEILKGWFGWQKVIDLGDLTGARAQEMMLAVWVRLYAALQTPMFNVHVVR